MVGYDSIIPPGREGTITPKVDISGLHGGEFRKSITVTSNAKNIPTLSLSVRGTLRAIIEATPPYLDLTQRATADSMRNIITLATERADLKVKEITFIAQGAAPAQGWQANLPIYINFKFSKVDTPRADGYSEYRVHLMPKIGTKERLGGEFLIKTNHPEKKEITLRGSIEERS